MPSGKVASNLLPTRVAVIDRGTPLLRGCFFLRPIVAVHQAPVSRAPNGCLCCLFPKLGRETPFLFSYSNPTRVSATNACFSTVARSLEFDYECRSTSELTLVVSISGRNRSERKCLPVLREACELGPTLRKHNVPAALGRQCAIFL